MSIDSYLNNNKSEKYHLGALFLDFMKEKPSEETFHIDAATGAKETNGSVLSRSISLAKCLRELGFRPGDVLALGGRNHLDLHIPYYAALLNGYPIVGVDPYFKYDEIRNLFKLTSPKIAFCQQESAEIYSKAAKDLGIDVKIVTFDGDNALSKFIEDHRGKDDGTNFQAAQIDTDKVYAWLVSTSGTTGLPKVAAFKHRILIDAILNALRMFSSNKPPADQERKIGLSLSPVQWISSYFSALSLPIMNRVKLQTSTPDDMGHVVRIINQYKPVEMMASPSMITHLLNHEEYCDLQCFNLLTITGSKVYKELILTIKKRLKPTAVLIEAYGQTETIGPALAPNPRGPLGNCGVPLPPHLREIKLVDHETGIEITDPNVPGELWSRGPSFTEYYNSPQATAEAFTEDGWYKTGDLLYHDQNNNYFFVDRIKSLIKYRSYHINPAELEELIVDKMAGVLEVCVVGVPHAEDGQHAVACVVRRAGSHTTAQEIKHLVASNLTASKQLRGVVFLDDLPRTSSGKIARTKLMALVANMQKE